MYNMEPLIFKHSTAVKKIIGAFWVLLGILNLILISDSPVTFSDWVKSIICIVLGLAFLTPITGQNETKFTADDFNLRIKWRTRIVEYVININEIEKIILRNKKIEILRKTKKKIVLSFGEWLWKVEDKRKVYEYMIKYAQLKNLTLEK
jgi:hypothetical protein